MSDYRLTSLLTFIHGRYCWFLSAQENGTLEAICQAFCRRNGPERTCEGLSAGIYPSQPLGCAEIWDLQHAAVSVDENIVALRIDKDIRENRYAHAFLEFHDAIWDYARCRLDKEQVATIRGEPHRRQNKVINIHGTLMTLIWPCCWIRRTGLGGRGRRP